MAPLRILLLYADADSTLSYQSGWLRGLTRHPDFRCTTVNLLERAGWQKARNELLVHTSRVQAVVLLHSVFSNACYLSGRLLRAVERLDRPKVFFLGNEYKLMPEKMALAEALQVALVISQSESPRVLELYRQRLGCRVAGIPSAGLDPDVFHPTLPRAERPIDIGYRAYDSPFYLGHVERRQVADFVSTGAAAQGFRVDVSLDPVDRLSQAEWAGFLNRCKAQIGSEAGGDYFELTDETRVTVIAYTAAHPEATFEDVHARFFAHYKNAVPLRIISGRNAEAAGTKTVQVLLEGEYNNYFRPDVHYVPLRKDFGNADDVFRKLRDPSYCEQIAQNAYEVAMAELTYGRLIERLRQELLLLV